MDFDLSDKETRDRTIRILRERLSHTDLRDIADDYGERTTGRHSFFEGVLQRSNSSRDENISDLVIDAVNHSQTFFGVVKTWRPDLILPILGLPQPPQRVQVEYVPEARSYIPPRSMPEYAPPTLARRTMPEPPPPPPGTPQATDKRSVFGPNDTRPLLLLLRRALNPVTFAEVVEYYQSRNRSPRENLLYMFSGGLDSQTRELLDDSQRTRSAHVLLEALEEVVPGLKGSLPTPIYEPYS